MWFGSWWAEWLFAFGRSSSSVSTCLLPLWVASAAAWGLASLFSLAFSFGVVVAPWFLVGVLQRFSPPGGFLLQFFLRVSCLRSGGGGFGWLSLAGPYVLRDVFSWCLFTSILFPSCATRGRFDVPGVLVSGSGLSASACSHACERFRGIALGPGADFPFVSLPGGRVV